MSLKGALVVNVTMFELACDKGEGEGGVVWADIKQGRVRVL